MHSIGGFGFDSNIYLIIDETVALIDAGTGMNFESVKRNLADFNLKPGDIELIINTHCHFDHAGGDRDFVAAGCEVSIHELEAELLRKGDQTITLAGGFGGRLGPMEVARELREGDRIKLGKLKLEVLHTPGHTLGSICLYEPKQRLLFSGDTVFCEGIGRVDLPTGDAAAMLKSLRRLARLEVQKLLPGHGPVVEESADMHVRMAHRLVKESRW
ncbi:MAG: MBL fold metallo-hydrolase [Candidatus Hodarchaeaceae archaeon]|nr:MBL fold metallo-hydrolase [Candidatus Hodarchaeaceae archaeon]